MCPHCVDYGMYGLVPIITQHTPQQQALPQEQWPPVQVVWVPCPHCAATLGGNGNSED